VIIGDGLRGDDDVDIEINAVCLKTAKIGRAIADADVIISMTHFKGHELTGFGGVIKNLGMGCASRQGKMVMHSSSRPFLDRDKCNGCRHCLDKCAPSAIDIRNGKASIDSDRCTGCGRCISACGYDAISAKMDQALDLLCRMTSEYAYASVIGKPGFHISFVTDVSPYCDFYSENDVPIIPDVGMFASFDPVALDTACADSANRQTAVAGSVLHGKIKNDKDDRFRCTHPATDWRVMTEHAEHIGMGVRKYVLKDIG
jgi:uncharacterized Fe-S center protein